MKVFKTLFSIALLATLSLSVLSCKKYEEGGRLGAADRKIINRWKVDHAFDLDDNHEVTNEYAGEIWEFTSESNFIVSGKLKGTYTFTEDRLSIVVLKTDGGSKVYNIVKLKSKELWVNDGDDDQIQLSELE